MSTAELPSTCAYEERMGLGQVEPWTHNPTLAPIRAAEVGDRQVWNEKEPQGELTPGYGRGSK